VGQGLGGQSLGEQGLGEQSLVGQSLGEQSLVGQSLEGQSLVGQDPVGQSLVGQSLVGQSLVGQSLVGQSLVGQDPVGQSLVGQDPVGQSLEGQSLVGQDLVGQDLDGRATAPPVPAFTRRPARRRRAPKGTEPADGVRRPQFRGINPVWRLIGARIHRILDTKCGQRRGRDPLRIQIFAWIGGVLDIGRLFHGRGAAGCESVFSAETCMPRTGNPPRSAQSHSARQDRGSVATLWWDF
jgi:hypothetical protein